MGNILIDSIEFNKDLHAIAKKLHIEPDSDEYCELDALLSKVAAIAKPKAVYRPVFIEEVGSDYVLLDNQRMQSTVMPKKLKDLHRVFVYVATCGLEIEQFSKSVTDMLHSWWMNSIMEFVLAQAVLALRTKVKKDFDLKKVASMSPGSLPDWPIDEQSKLFSLLGDAEKLIGVTLTDSMLMVPAKTVSGFYFETDTDYVNCQLCKRDKCIGRKQPFDQKKYEALFGNQTAQ